MSYRNVRPVRIDKKWGHELCVVTKHAPKGAVGYSGKILTVKQGWQSSIHYHIDKTETFFILEGKLILELYRHKLEVPAVAKAPRPITMDDVRLELSTVLEPGQGMTLDPLTPHRFWALSLDGCKFVEFSTPDDPADSYRITQSGPRANE